ncbi:OR1FC protein, partial [Polypterus senegalus]
MSISNSTDFRVQEFIIFGFPGFQERENKNILFAIFLTAYLLILLGNLLILIIFAFDEGLHIPMYVLISSLAVVDIAISSTTVPKMLDVLSFDNSFISFGGCLTQMGFYLALVTTESFLLAVMAYDRYLAICNPLHYASLMNNSLVLKQIACCWTLGIIVGLILVGLALRLPFCGPNKVIHCFCDHSSVVRLACADIVINNYMGLTLAMTVLFIPLTYILFSYIKIITSVLKIKSAEGRLKAFSTCGTHLLIISVFFLAAAFVYISYRIPGTSADVRIMAAVLQNVTPPLMNPIIYCLRNKEIRGSLVKTFRRSRILPNTRSFTF